MPLSGSGNTNSGPVSSLNLEPNPFEQSFATTETSATNNNNDGNNAISNSFTNTVPPQPMIPATSLSQIPQVLQQPHVLTQKSPYSSLQSPPPLLERTSNLSISQLTSNNRDNATSTVTTNNNNSTTHTNITNSNNPSISSNDSTMKKPTLGPTFSSSFVFSNIRPNIQSPGALTPGGSKKLPPLMLSPNFIPLGTEDGNPSNQPTINTNTTTSTTNSNTNGTLNTNVNNPNNTNSNGYFSYIPRTGLTPNESSIRSGLTPGSMYPVLPSIGLNNNNNTANNNSHSTTSSLPNSAKGTMTPGFPGNKTMGTVVNDYIKMTNNANNKYNMTPSGSVFGTPAPFTPGINSILNMNGNSQPNTIAPVGELVNNTPAIKVENDNNLNHQMINHNDVGTGSTRKNRKASTSSNKSKKRKGSSSSNEGTNFINQTGIGKPTMDGSNTTMKPTGNKNMGQEYFDERERKRREFLERNRLAASKFRKRKKEYIQKIEHDFRNLQTEYDEMRSIMDAMCSFNSYKANASILTKLRFHLQQNDVAKAVTELDQLQSLVEHTEYFKRNGQSVISLEDTPSEAPEIESNDQSLDKYTRTIKSSTTLPPNPPTGTTGGKSTISIIPEFKETTS